MHALASKPKALVPPTAPMSSSKTHTTESAKHHHIWLVTGPAGCGKSTVAQHLAKSLDVPYIEGDEFHPKSNIEKMSSNIPLTDADRWDWLTILREESLKQLSSGSSGVVLTCSALKRKYRDVIRVAPYYDSSLLVHFIYLHAPEEVLIERVRSRHNHYMGSTMVHSQFDILEPPAADESDVITIDSTKSQDEVKTDALAKVLDVIHDDGQ
ncbi:putative glucokinase protein [Zalerion maritima]|uniref:Gluconokinase n=1 Tax=Zalerion maritima TaxID=339359 RepID=A0AAD5WXZ8_9PEZI|nr:putative glucokinase protein [Zalerion maritima]